MKQQASGQSSTNDNNKGSKSRDARSNKIYDEQEIVEQRSGQRQEEILRMRDTNSAKGGAGKVAKSLGVARSINFAATGHHDKKYDFLFDDDEVEAETPRNNQRVNG